MIFRKEDLDAFIDRYRHEGDCSVSDAIKQGGYRK